RLDAGALDHCRAGHVSAEAGHRDLLRELKLDPLLDLNMRLGEASGAGVAIPLIRAALACHAGMATFAEAGVSGAGDLRNLATYRSVTGVKGSSSDEGDAHANGGHQ